MRTATLILVATLTALARPQALDLGGPIPPPPDAQPALRLLLQRAEAEFEAELRRRVPPSRDADYEAGPPPLPRPGDLDPAVPLELRRIAVALAARAHARDQLWARTITRHLAALSRLDDAAVAAALRAAIADPPEGDALDRALRDALGALIVTPPPPEVGWPLVPRIDPAAPIADIDERAPQSAHAAVDAIRVLDPAAVPPALARPARALRARTDAALDLFRPQPTWYPRDDARAHADAVLAAIVDITLADPGAGPRLDHLAAVAAAARALDALPRSRSLRDTRLAALNVVRNADPSTNSGAGAALDGANRFASLLTRAEPPADRDDLIRVLRPAWPRLLDQRRRARERLADFLPRTLALANPSADPAFLAKLTEAERADARLAGLGHVSLVLCGGTLPEPPRRPEPLGRHEPLARRLLEVVRDLPGRRDGESPLAPSDAEVVLDAFLADAQRFVPTAPGVAPEATLVTDLSFAGVRRTAWRRLTADRPNDVLDELQSRRESWLASWNTPSPGDPRGAASAERHATWIASAHEWLALAKAAVDLSTARQALRRGVAPRSVAWPGWEMDEDVCDALLRPFEADLARAWVVLAAGDGRLAARVLAEARREHAAARLAGLLEAGLDPLPRRSAREAALDETAAGPVDAAVCRFGPARDRIAEACRWAFEVEASRGDEREAFATLANDAARRALRSLGVW